MTGTDVAQLRLEGLLLLRLHFHLQVALHLFRTLAEKGINILAITTSEIKVSVLISSDYTELAVRALHAAGVPAGGSN